MFFEEIASCQHLILILIGLMSGLCAGILGIGGGIIVVPALNVFFQMYGFEHSSLQIAQVTSLGVMFLTTLSSTLTHLKVTEHDKYVSILLIGVLVGSCFGRFASGYLSPQVGAGLFLLVVSFISVRMIFQLDYEYTEQKLKRYTLGFLSAGTAIVGSIVGIGVGAMLVPWLLTKGFIVGKATRVGAIGSFVLASTNVAYLLVEHLCLGGTRMTVTNDMFFLGAISLDACIYTGIASLVTAPLGVILTRKIQPRIFKAILLAILFGLAIYSFKNLR